MSQFERGRIYQGGNVKDFSNITGWTGQKVLYIGDHIYSDLVDPTAQEGWRTVGNNISIFHLTNFI